jgi:hypothetical protein
MLSCSVYNSTLLLLSYVANYTEVNNKSIESYPPPPSTAAVKGSKVPDKSSIIGRMTDGRLVVVCSLVDDLCSSFWGSDTLSRNVAGSILHVDFRKYRIESIVVLTAFDYGRHRTIIRLIIRSLLS